jgi:hypothetical protein
VNAPLPLFADDLALACAVARRDLAFPHTHGAQLVCDQCARFANIGVVMTDEPGTCGADGHECATGAGCTVPLAYTPDARTFAERYPRYPAEYLALTGADYLTRAKRVMGKAMLAMIEEGASTETLGSHAGVNVAPSEYTDTEGAA